MRTSGASLIKLLKMLPGSSNVRQNKKIGQGRGRPTRYSVRSITAVWFIMMFKQIRTFKGVHKFLRENPGIRKYCGFDRLPDRVTLSRRLKTLFSEFLNGQSYNWKNKFILDKK